MKTIDQKSEELLAKLLNEDAEFPSAEKDTEPAEHEDTKEKKPEGEEPEDKKPEVDKKVSKKEQAPEGDKKEKGGVNGWKNHATWNVALWLSNDEGLYSLARECANYKELVDLLRENGVTETPDKVAFNDSALDLKALDDEIAEMKASGPEEEEGGDGEDAAPEVPGEEEAEEHPDNRDVDIDIRADELLRREMGEEPEEGEPKPEPSPAKPSKPEAKKPKGDKPEKKKEEGLPYPTED